MIDWAIIPGEGITDLRLGDDRNQVRQRFGVPRSFKRTPEAAETDQFPADGILATYDGNGLVAFIELARPAKPTIHGIELLGEGIEQVITQLNASGVEALRDMDGAKVPSWRVGLYAPSGIIEGVAIGE